MGIASVRHRVRRLERNLTPVECTPLTQIEIASIIEPTPGYEPPPGLARRIEAQGHIVEGANIISADRGQIIVKRYLGVDPSQI